MNITQIIIIQKLLVELFDVLNANIYKVIVFCYAIIWKIKLFV